MAVVTCVLTFARLLCDVQPARAKAATAVAAVPAPVQDDRVPMYADAEEFIYVFVNQTRWLVTFLEAVVEKGKAKPSVLHTLLELYLDLVPGRHAGRLSVLGGEREHEHVPVGRDRAPVDVAVDRHGHGRSLLPLAQRLHDLGRHPEPGGRPSFELDHGRELHRATVRPVGVASRI